MIRTEKEFYCILKTAIENKIGKKRDDFSTLKEISRPTYYNIKNFCEGNKDSPRLSVTKIEKVCKELDIPFQEVYFKLKDK